jgi:hypothetical protein
MRETTENMVELTKELILSKLSAASVKPETSGTFGDLGTRREYGGSICKGLKLISSEMLWIITITTKPPRRQRDLASAAPD